MYDVISLGEILIDFTSQGKNTDGQRLFAQNAGGAPANVAVAVARLGGDAAFIGKTGADMHGRFLRSTLESNGVDCTYLYEDKNHFTTLAFVDLKDNGEREFSFARMHGADKMLTKDEVPEDIIKSGRIFHFGSVSLTDEPSRSATLYAAECAKNAGVIVAYDPNYRASLWKNEKTAKKEMRNALKFADMVKISEEETELLTDETDFEKAAERLIDSGVKIAVVTLGEKGAYVRTKDGGKFVEGFKANAVDCTGAGDAFWGAFLVWFAKFKKFPDEITLENAAFFTNFGNSAGSLCVEKYGAIPSLPYQLNVVERIVNKK
ncbi:MAG: carbohydrate kinase [Clostridia bacterium]|nr:carbohydrate kinase [Clostridia bacterium]